MHLRESIKPQYDRNVKPPDGRRRKTCTGFGRGGDRGGRCSGAGPGPRQTEISTLRPWPGGAERTGASLIREAAGSREGAVSAGGAAPPPRSERASWALETCCAARDAGSRGCVAQLAFIPAAASIDITSGSVTMPPCQLRFTTRFARTFGFDSNARLFHLPRAAFQRVGTGVSPR